MPGASIAKTIDKYRIRASGSPKYYGLVASGESVHSITDWKPNLLRAYWSPLRYLLVAIVIGYVILLDCVPRWAFPKNNDLVYLKKNSTRPA